MGPAKAEPQLRERSQLARAGKLYERRCQLSAGRFGPGFCRTLIVQPYTEAKCEYPIGLAHRNLIWVWNVRRLQALTAGLIRTRL